MTKKTKKTGDLTFMQAVEITPDVTTCYKTGLRALGKHSSKISVSDTQKLSGSIDIDSCTQKKYPQSNRWDYCFGYNGEAFFVEVHSANSSQVSVVLKKLEWLKDWLNYKATEIDKMKSKNRPAFYWIQSAGFAIPPTSRQFIAAKTAGLLPISKLHIK